MKVMTIIPESKLVMIVYLRIEVTRRPIGSDHVFESPPVARHVQFFFGNHDAGLLKQ